MTAIDFCERDRRWSLLQAAMAVVGLDALIVGGTDFRGQKGGLRYVTDFKPFHRFGYAVLPAQGEPVAVLHPVLSYCPLGSWVTDKRFSAAPGAELAAVVAALPRHDRVGLVAVDQVMRVGDHAELVARLPDTRFEPADRLFERVRGVKSAVEIAGLEEAARIADLCFERLLEIARPGLSEREIHAEMLRSCFREGGEEPLFLTMYAEPDGAVVKPVIAAPGTRLIGRDQPFNFSLELIGPSGHWVEFCRILGFEADGAAADIAAICHASVASGLSALAPGVAGPAVQAGLEAPVDMSIYEVCPWSGHAIGQDVIEMPMIGRSAAAGTTLDAGMAFAMHPMIHHRTNGPLGYVADTYLFEADGPRRLSRWPLQFFRPA